MARLKTATIIGAGVIGIASAYALAMRGVAVTIIDRSPRPAMGASHANGAQLSYCYTDALASASIWRELPRLAMGMDPAFRMHFPMDWQYAKWLSRFLCNCTNSRFEKHTLAGMELADQSRLAMQALLEKHDMAFHHETKGKLHLYHNATAFQKAGRIVRLKNGNAARQNVLTPDAAVQVEPALEAVLNRMAGAIHTPSEQVGDPFLFCQAMVAILQDAYGMTTIFEQEAERINPDKGGTTITLANGDSLRSDIAIICGASQSNRLLNPLGLTVPVEPMKGYSFEMPISNGSPTTSITDTKRRIVFTNLGDRMRVAGLADLGDRTNIIRDHRKNTLVALARQSLPDGGNYALADKFWTGLRPMTPNSLPIISNPLPGVAINTGHGMLGWTMAMGSGERLAKLLLAA